MKRPFAVIGFTAFGMLLILALAESNGLAYFALFAGVSSGTLSLLKKNLRQTMTLPVLFSTAATVCLLFLLNDFQLQSTRLLVGDELSVIATVYEEPYFKTEYNRSFCVLKLEEIDGKSASGKLRLSFTFKDDGIDKRSLRIGNRVSFTARVYIPGKADKSISRYFTSENILLGAYNARDFTIIGNESRGLDFYLQRLRQYVSDKLAYGFGSKISGLLTAMLTGEKNSLAPKIYESFRRTGVAHLMAVSGLHLSLWIFALGSILPERKNTKKPRTLLLMSAVIFIMLLSGMSESVKRAGFMCLVFLSSGLLKRESDSLNSLGFSVTLMLLFNPACVLSASLQLSFLSTLGIITLGKQFTKRTAELFGGKKINTLKGKLLRYILDMFFINISVLIFTLPVLLYSFGSFSTVSAPVNIIISPVVSPLLILSGLCVIFRALPFVFYPLAFIVKHLTDFIIFVTDFFSEFENACIITSMESTPLILSALIMLFLLSLVILTKPFKGKRLISVISLFAVSVLIMASKGVFAFN